VLLAAWLLLAWPFGVAAEALGPGANGQTAAAPAPAGEHAALTVVVPLPPLRWLVAGIAGPEVEVALLVPAGASAEVYDPSPQELGRFTRAQLFFALDTPVERRWLPRLRHLNAGMEVVPLPLPLPQLDWSGRQRSAELPARPSEDPTLDFHGWGSPAVLASWIDAVVAALTAARPGAAADLAAGGRRVRAELEALDRELARLLEPYRGRSFLTLHPAWGYFAHRYGLEQLALEERGREPGPRTLARVLAAARAARVQQIFVPPRARAGFVRRAAGELSAEVVEVDELAEDYPATLRRFAQALVRGFDA
jgi:zinc transport system substrate-binding protein